MELTIEKLRKEITDVYSDIKIVAHDIESQQLQIYFDGGVSDQVIEKIEEKFNIELEFEIVVSTKYVNFIVFNITRKRQVNKNETR